MPNSTVKSINNYDGSRPEPPYDTVELVDTEEAIDADPFIQEMRAEIAACREQIAILTGTHPLFKVYHAGRGWTCEYKGKFGKVKWTALNTAEEAMDKVTGWKAQFPE